SRQKQAGYRDQAFSQQMVLFLSNLLFTVITVDLTGNLLIIMLVSISHHLHSPMYFFLCHLSVSDIVLSTNTLPNLLDTILHECFLLAVMSYDRYLAICVPLRYVTIMDFTLCTCLSVLPWILGFTLNLTGIIPISNFQFCDGNKIEHIYCEFSPLQKLSCSDTSLVKFLAIVLSTPLFICPCAFITVTYVHILLVIFRIPSTTGRQKTFSTCSSHLFVVGTFYGTLIMKYMIPSIGNVLLLNKIISLLHAVFTPLFNPLVYSLRNQDIRTALRKISEQIKIISKQSFVHSILNHVFEDPEIQKYGRIYYEKETPYVFLSNLLFTDCFGNLYGFNILIFIIFLNIFLITVTGNLLIIMLVSISHHLHSPMYFFLCHLSVSDIVLSTNTLPNLLDTILHGGKRMTIFNCITQYYFYS
ncbi:olfactory receptor 11A1-like, partial [Pelobates cultripes]